MLIDEVDVTFEGGHGGAGKVAFNPGRFGGPSGGNGGKGGNLILTVTSDIGALNQFSQKTHFVAENGEGGGSNKKTGKNGEDLKISLPIGTTVINKQTEESFELIDLNQEVLICKGGLGGRGNYEFKSPTNTTPMNAQPGLRGATKHLKLLLKLIADCGLIGLPNAGKSSLLNELTKANVKVGSYPFTTLEPGLGVLHGKVIADIPGLIEGASEGKGLGIKFLKHIEKVRLLLHCIAADTISPEKDYQTVRTELGSYNPALLAKEEIILLTKSDLIPKGDLKKKIAEFKKTKKKVYPISIYDWDSIEKLKQIL